MIPEDKYCVEMFLRTKWSEYVLHTGVRATTEVEALNKVFEAAKKEDRKMTGALIEKSVKKQTPM